MTKPYFSIFNRFMHDRLQKLGVCMSHKSTVRLITSVGKDHDRKVIEWQNNSRQCWGNKILLVLWCFKVLLTLNRMKVILMCKSGPQLTALNFWKWTCSFIPFIWFWIESVVWWIMPKGYFWITSYSTKYGNLWNSQVKWHIWVGFVRRITWLQACWW